MLDFGEHERNELVENLLPQLREFYDHTKELNVAQEWNIHEVKAAARRFSLEKGTSAVDAVNHVTQGLKNLAVHTPHPNYFGLFNPRTSFASIIGDLITATYNPQMAAWSHAPFANEIEVYLIEELGRKFGYAEDSIDGTFCSGGAESNLTAVLCAINHAFPQYEQKGAQGIAGQPVIYTSSESHHSLDKAAKMTGLGRGSVCSIPVLSNLKMDLEALQQQIRKDRKEGKLPFMVVGTAGATGTGTIDPLTEISRIAKQENLWFHVDAAYGGAITISQQYRDCLAGIELSDSITLDLHKWFSVPMGTSVLVTSKTEILHQTFRIQTAYMPEDGDPAIVVDPYLHSVQWSRRFMGLKAYLPIVIHGWAYFERLFNFQIELADQLRSELLKRNWKIENDTRLPVICFKSRNEGYDMNALVRRIADSGEAWLSVYPIHGSDTARLCINNYNTGENEIREFLELLDEVR